MEKQSLERLILVLLVFLLMTACAVTQFKPFQGDENVFEGKGGAMLMIDGMELWDYGEPPRKYMVLGFIEDERSGPYSKWRLYGDVVKKAREVGGDAVIKPADQSQLVKYYSSGSVGVYSSSGYYSGSGIGASISVPLNKNINSFIVIRFLD